MSKNIFSPIKSAISDYVFDKSSENLEANTAVVQPRASKEINVGNPISNSKESSMTTTLIDTTDSICVIKDIDLNQDAGNFMQSIIYRLKEGQLILVDFSQCNEDDKTINFHTLWGAVMSLNGSYKLVDDDGDYVLFTSDNNSIGETRFQKNETEI